MKFTVEKKEKLSDNLTPLIDIIFSILIFFLVLFRFSTFNTGAEDTDNLPQGNLSETFALKQTIIAEVNENGNIFINGKQVENNIEDIEKHIQNPEDKNCILIVNDNAPYEAFGTLINNFENIGIKKISMIE